MSDFHLGRMCIHPSQEHKMSAFEAEHLTRIINDDMRNVYHQEELDDASFYFWTIQEEAAAKGKAAVQMAVMATHIWIQIKRTSARAKKVFSLDDSLTDNALNALDSIQEEYSKGINALKDAQGNITNKTVDLTVKIKNSKTNYLRQLSNLVKEGLPSKDYSDKILNLQRSLKEVLEQIGATPESRLAFQGSQLDVMSQLLALGSKIREEVGEGKDGEKPLIDLNEQLEYLENKNDPARNTSFAKEEDEVDAMPTTEIREELLELTRDDDY